MSELFSQKKAPTATYSAEDIEVLEGLEPVRRRPGMYIGGTDERALHHLVVELIDNAMDEAVAGHANKINVILQENGSITIRDNGRGIPIDPHPKFPKKSALEVILTTLHSGAKFGGKSYATAGGLHGVGLSVVNALSAWLTVDIFRERKLWHQRYERGNPTGPIEMMGDSTIAHGTQISFLPDPLIFGEDAAFKPALLFKMVRSKAYLFKGVTISWECPENMCEGDVQPKTLFHFPGGLSDYLKETQEGIPQVNDKFFTGEAEFLQGKGRVEWALTWPLQGDTLSSSYCNTIRTPEGGTHENGFRLAILKGLRTYGELTGNKKAAQLTGDDCFNGASFILSVFLPNPQFQGQTKEKLATQGAARLVETSLKDHFDHWLTAHPTMATELLEHVVTQMEERVRRKQAKEVSRASATRKLRLPGKLADCSISAAEGTEIFLVEGDSAGGSAKQARDRKKQAILPLRGKILNVASATLEKVQANQQIANIVLALGCGIGKDCDRSKLRYERIIIMTDADVDGAHIASLLITFFFQKMRPLIEGGHLYLAQPPLYRLSTGSKTIYAQDDADRERILTREFKGVKKVDVSRFKGLGEMPARQLKETTMDPKKRVLQRVSLSPDTPLQDIKVFVDNLMGRHAEKRFTYIQENASFVRDLDL